MHATLLTDVGLLVDGRVIQRIEDEKTQGKVKLNSNRESWRGTFVLESTPLDLSPQNSLFPQNSTVILEEEPPAPFTFEELQCLPYECETHLKIPQRRFEFMDILPWGFRSPTSVYSTVGLHTNKGLVVGVGPAGFIRVRPYHQIRSKADRVKYGNEAFSLCQMSSSTGTTSRHNQGQTDNFSTLPLIGKHPAKRPLNEKGYLTDEAIQFFSEKCRAPEAIEKRRAFFRIAEFLRDRETKTRQGIEMNSRSCLGGIPAPFTPPSPQSPQSTIGTAGISPFSPGDRSGGPAADTLTYAENVNSLLSLFVPEEDATEECLASHERLLEQWTSDLELWDIADLQLAPSLGLHPPISPCKVGSRVMARRFGGCIEIATVIAAQYDVSYTLLYDSDGGIDTGVLHNDIHLIDDIFAEPCTVRDRVVVTLQMQVPAIIVEALGKERYRVVLVNSGFGDSIPVQLQNIALITPLLKDGLYSDPQHVQWFKELDPTCTGTVTWRLVRDLIREIIVDCGLPLTEAKLRRIQSTISSKGQAAVRHQFFHIEDNMPLTFVEFEYALLSAQNMVD